MRIPRIYTPQTLAVRVRVLLDARAARHVSRVLRLRAGAFVHLFNGDGREYRACIVAAGKREVEIETLEARTTPAPGKPRFTLIQGVAKGDHMDYALQKAVELGAYRLVPALTEHSVVKLDQARLARRMDHWRGILIGASEQCGRYRLPELDQAADVNTILSRLPEESLRLVLDRRAELTLSDLAQPENDVVILAGPEGGLSAHEQELVGNSGFVPIRLGPYVLRTETAPLAALAAAQALWGDFR